jgi:hypothetical protein
MEKYFYSNGLRVLPTPVSGNCPIMKPDLK